MRRALPLLLLLAACEPRRDPRNIERALSAKIIDVERVEDLLGVEEGALRLITPPSIKVGQPQETEWLLENRGRRPVWLYREDLKVQVQYTPEFRLGFASYLAGGGREPIRTPASFVPEEWHLLCPGDRIPLPLSDGLDAMGTYNFSVYLEHHGLLLSQATKATSQGLPPVGPGSIISKGLVASVTECMILPPPDWPGDPWHGEHSIDPTPMSGQRFELVTLRPERFVSTVAMPLEGFVLNEAGELVFHGAVSATIDEWTPVCEDEQGGIAIHRAVYRIPSLLTPGSYRLWLRVDQAEAYFAVAHRCCDAPRSAASRWIPFRVE